MQDDAWVKNIKVCFDLDTDESWAKFIHKPQNFRKMFYKSFSLRLLQIQVQLRKKICEEIILFWLF